MARTVRLLALLFVCGVIMSSAANAQNAQNRLWVQVLESCEPPTEVVKGIALSSLADLVASGVGAIVKSAADRLLAADQYSLKTVLAYEPAFVLRRKAISASFLPRCITLNVGTRALPVCRGGGEIPLAFADIEKLPEYEQSPVVIRLEIDESADGTAVAARVTHWKYAQFLDPSPTPFRTPLRKLTVELKVSDPDGGALLATAIQVVADSGTLANVRPNDGERLPWMKRPLKNFSGVRELDEEQRFGPVNIEASITEVAEPSAFAKILGSTLGSQKAAIEGFVKDRVTQSLDESAAAKARLASLKDASAAFADYQTAYDDAAKARKIFAAATGEAKNGAAQILQLKLATLGQKEILTRAAFDAAGLVFAPLATIGER